MQWDCNKDPFILGERGGINLVDLYAQASKKT